MIALLAAAAIGACTPDTMKAFVPNGDTAEPYALLLKSGRRLTIDGQDFIHPRDWRSGEPLEICPDPQEAQFDPDRVVVHFFIVRNLKRQERLTVTEPAEKR